MKNCIVSMKTCNSSLRSIRHFGILIIILSLIIGCNGSKKNNVQAKNPNGRNDTWTVLGYGGGGAMFSPAVSPHDADFAFVACDMTGSFVTYNGGLSWRMFSLRSPVRYFVFDPMDSNVVYANSIGLFKSTDRGTTWSVVYPHPSEILGVVSKNNDELYGDEAKEYIITKDSTRRDVLAFTVDPANSAKLYAAISINKIISFYVSEDGGEHWKLEKELEAGIKKIFIDPSSPKDNRTIYVAGSNGITQKVNGIWKDNKKPKDVASFTVFSGGYDRQQKKYLIYSISGKSYFNSEKNKSGIYFTADGGLTWENRQYGLLTFNIKGADLPEWRTIATSAFHPEVVYVSYNGLKVNEDTTCIGVAKSEDFGKTWKLVWKDRLTTRGDLNSDNYKKGWLDERFGPIWGENPFEICVSPSNPEVCYTTDFGRTNKTSNGGKTWEQLYTKKKEGAGWTSRGLDVTTGHGLAFDPFDLNHMFIDNTDIGLMESKDGGESWMSSTKNNGVPDKWVNTTYWLTFDPEVKGKAWSVMSETHDLPRSKMWAGNGIAGFNGGILMTENSGKTWHVVSADIGEAAMTFLLIDPSSSKKSRTLYACAFGKGVYKSVDGGKSWLQKNKGISGTEPFAYRITRRENDGALFLVVSKRSEDGSKIGSIYKSEDGAENWTKISLPDGTNAPTSIAIDKLHPKQLVLSAWGRVTQGQFTPDIGGGIFLSGDEGKSWKQVLEKDQHIGVITFDSRNNRFYACGFGGSAYYSEDGGNVWNRIKGYNFKWGQRVEPDPRDPEKIFIITFGGGVWYGPAKGDENAKEDIVTPVLAY